MNDRLTDPRPSMTVRRWNATVNLCDLLLMRHVAEGRGDSIALLYRDRVMSYQDVAEMTYRFAAVMQDSGVGADDRVVLLLPDSPAFVAAFFATLYLGATVVPLNPQLPYVDIAEILQRLDARLALVDHTKSGEFSKGDLGCRTMTCGDSAGTPGYFDRCLSLARPIHTPMASAEGRAAYCLFSSGTTGRPKGIPHLHSDILHCIEAYSLPTLQMSSVDRVLAVPKLTFGYGLGGNLLSTFYVGGTSILVDTPSSGATMLAAAEKYRPTLFLAQPRALGELIQLDCRRAFSSLRLAVSAGEVLAPSLYARWHDKVGVDVLDGFGTTEVGHVFVSNAIGKIVQGSAGRVLPPFEIELRNNAGQVVAPGEVGELWVRGPSVSRGYLDDPERTEKMFVNGWVRTGDLASRDNDGSIYFAGRADEMIKAGCGQWVSPTELESVLMGHPAVAEAAVVGVSNGLGVVSPRAFVILNQDCKATLDLEDELCNLVVNRWPELPHKHLSSLEFVSSLPKTSTGKLRRFMLRPASLTEFSYQCS